MSKKKKKSSPDLKESVNKVWLAGLGAVAAAEEEGQKWFKTLVTKGETYQKRGKSKLDDVRERIEDVSEKAKERAGDTMNIVEEKVDDLVNGALRRTGVPNREEIAALTKRVEELTKMVEQLKPVAKPAARKPAARKPAARKPAARKPAARKPAARKPAASKAADSKPTASKPAAGEKETTTAKA